MICEAANALIAIIFKGFLGVECYFFCGMRLIGLFSDSWQQRHNLKLTIMLKFPYRQSILLCRWNNEHNLCFSLKCAIFRDDFLWKIKMCY